MRKAGNAVRQKGRGFGKGIFFARPLFLSGGWVCVAEDNAQVSQSFVQKRFVLRPVISTNLNIANFASN